MVRLSKSSNLFRRSHRPSRIVIASAGLISLILVAGAYSRLSGPSVTAPDAVVVYKSPTCHCCSKWVDHLRTAGFTVDVRGENAMHALKARVGVPDAMASCHTAVVGGYLIEGHVPAQDIRRLLSERPKAKGLAVPGMPVGSPGMEQGDRLDPFEVLLFADGTEPKVFATYGPAVAR